MKLIKTGILFISFILLCSIGGAQSINQIKKEKEKSEKEISYLNQLLKEARNNKTVSVERLNIIRQKISQSKRLIESLSREVHYLESQIRKNEDRIAGLNKNRESMLDMYAKLIYGLWKKKDKTNILMFIFAASDFNQAYNRYKYFEQIQTYSRRQLSLIGQMNDSLDIRNKELNRLVTSKNVVLQDINIKNKDLAEQQVTERKLIQDLQSREKEITRKLDTEKKNRKKLERELSKLIAQQAKKSGSSSSAYKMTPEEKLLSDDFVKNKGKLPWPVAEGIITEKFGVNTHPVYKRVSIENYGINITTSKNAEIRAVFNGVVSEIWLMPGFNNVVIIRHGNYLTSYSNLVDLNVKKGQKVSTKQVIGKVAYDENKGSVLNFQVWNNMERQNPELWLAK